MATYLTYAPVNDGKVNERMNNPSNGCMIAPGAVGLSHANLDELVEEAIADANGAGEQLLGRCSMIEENLTLPFETKVLASNVTVADIGRTDWGSLPSALSAHRQSIVICELPLPVPARPGSERIASRTRSADRRVPLSATAG